MNKYLFPIILGFLVVVLAGVVTSDVNGANNVTEVNNTRAGTDSPENHSAVAGNVTEITITGTSITQAWQGYFGNVSGTIELANSAGSIMYNWSQASPQGEIFASNASSISWADIACFNWSQNGTTWESMFNISAGDADGINETFSDASAHDAFQVGSVSFAEDDCMASFIFDDTGASVDNFFEEVLLTDETNLVFASILEQNELGFDNRPHDFEMLVLEDGHGTDTQTTPYFFYLELE